MATQLQKYLLFISPFLLLWVLMYFNIVPTYYDKKTVLISAPLLSIAALGLYAAYLVIYGVLTFNDCYEAREELIRDIAEAKEDLRRRKIIE